MNYNQNQNVQSATKTQAREFDAGLQAHMQKVYKVMSFGLVVTALVGLGVASSEAALNLIFNTPLQWVILFAPLAIIWFGFTPQRAHRMSTTKLRGIFYLLSALYGATFSILFIMFTGESLMRVFFITAGTFAAMSILGYTTKKDLTNMGSFLLMGLIGIIIASIVNIFVASSMVSFIVSILGVIIFTLMTAFDTQRIKESYAYSHGDVANDKMATLGALSLYLNFIMLFQSLVHIMGQQR